MLSKLVLLSGATAAVASLAAAPASAQGDAPGVRIEHAAARVVVIPEARSNVSVTISGGDSRLPRPVVRTEGGTVLVDGGLDRRIGSCGGFGIVMGFGPHRDQTMRVWIRGVGPLALERLPVITARVPLDASVAAGDAVWGEVGPTRSLGFANKGCGNWTVGDVKGALSVALTGSGDLHGGSAGAVKAAVSGSSDVKLGDVGSLEAAVAGSGNIHVRHMDGPLSAKIAGSGNVTVDGGNAPNVAATVSGSGDLRFGGEAGAVAARVAGSGDVRIARATGPVSRSVAGSGDVIVGR